MSVRCLRIWWDCQFLVPIKGFSNRDLECLINIYQLTNFSKEALKSWHELATKLSIEERW